MNRALRRNLAKKLETGNYKLAYNRNVGGWVECDKKDLENALMEDSHFILVHRKDWQILDAYLKNKGVEIEWYVSHNGYPYVWDDFCLDFIKDYDEDCEYRLKIIKKNCLEIMSN